MCCIFCVSFRGAAYFGTTTQILIGLAIVIKYSTSLPNVKLSDFQDVSSGPIAILFSYGLLIFTFGCCIFRGIESESLRTLKVCVGSLTILQSLVLLTHLILISLSFDVLKEDERISQVSVLGGNLILTFLQLTTLFLYMIRLAKRELAFMSRSCTSGVGMGGIGLIQNNSNCNSSESSLPLSSSGFINKTNKFSSNSDCALISNTNNGTLHGHGHHNHGRYSVGSSNSTNTAATSSSSLGQRYIDGQWENLHV